MYLQCILSCFSHVAKPVDHELSVDYVPTIFVYTKHVGDIKARNDDGMKRLDRRSHVIDTVADKENVEPACEPQENIAQRRITTESRDGSCSLLQEEEVDEAVVLCQETGMQTVAVETHEAATQADMPEETPQVSMIQYVPVEVSRSPSPRCSTGVHIIRDDNKATKFYTGLASCYIAVSVPSFLLDHILSQTQAS